MNTKHTPGPWTATMVEPDDGSQPSLWHVHGGDTSLEATICELWSGEHDNEACARLIAAAPDLYEALIELLNAEDYSEIVSAKLTAREILAKIRGE